MCSEVLSASQPCTIVILFGAAPAVLSVLNKLGFQDQQCFTKFVLLKACHIYNMPALKLTYLQRTVVLSFVQTCIVLHCTLATSCHCLLLCSGCAVLCCAVRCCAVVCCAVLCCAVPCRAVPCRAVPLLQLAVAAAAREGDAVIAAVAAAVVVA